MPQETNVVNELDPQKHAKTKEHKYTNRLANEPSPYLEQHKHNPVDWYPWGDEAFKKAKDEDKPILLSIGYSIQEVVSMTSYNASKYLKINDIGKIAKGCKSNFLLLDKNYNLIDIYLNGEKIVR